MPAWHKRMVQMGPVDVKGRLHSHGDRQETRAAHLKNKIINLLIKIKIQKKFQIVFNKNRHTSPPSHDALDNG